MSTDEMTNPTPWEPPLAGTDVEQLVGSLERMRATFRWKTDGLGAAGLQARVGASSLTLGGLLKHLASSEDYIFTHKLRGEVLEEAAEGEARGSDAGPQAGAVEVVGLPAEGRSHPLEGAHELLDVSAGERWLPRGLVGHRFGAHGPTVGRVPDGRRPPREGGVRRSSDDETRAAVAGGAGLARVRAH